MNHYQQLPVLYPAVSRQHPPHAASFAPQHFIVSPYAPFANGAPTNLAQVSLFSAASAAPHNHRIMMATGPQSTADAHLSAGDKPVKSPDAFKLFVGQVCNLPPLLNRNALLLLKTNFLRISSNISYCFYAIFSSCNKIPRHFQEPELRQVLEPYGEIYELLILKDRATGNSRGCAFVTFCTREAAVACIAELHEQRTLEGMAHPLQV